MERESGGRRPGQSRGGQNFSPGCLSSWGSRNLYIFHSSQGSPKNLEALLPRRVSVVSLSHASYKQAKTGSPRPPHPVFLHRHHQTERERKRGQNWVERRGGGCNGV